MQNVKRVGKCTAELTTIKPSFFVVLGAAQIPSYMVFSKVRGPICNKFGVDLARSRKKTADAPVYFCNLRCLLS